MDIFYLDFSHRCHAMVLLILLVDPEMPIDRLDHLKQVDRIALSMISSVMILEIFGLIMTTSSRIDDFTNSLITAESSKVILEMVNEYSKN